MTDSLLVSTQSLRLKQETENIYTNVRNMDVSLRGYALTGDKRFLFLNEQAAKAVNNRNVRVVDSLLKVQNFPGIYELHQLAGQLEAYTALYGEMVRLLEQQDRARFTELLAQDQGKKLWNQYEQFSKRVEAHQDQLHQKAQSDYQSTMVSSLLVQALLIFLGLPILGMLYYRLRQQEEHRKALLERLARQNRKYLFDSGQATSEAVSEDVVEQSIEHLERATGFITELARGNYHISLTGLTEENKNVNQENLAGRLVELQVQLLQSKAADQQRLWATEGLREFSEIIRQQGENLTELTDQALAYLVKYLDAQQGSLFVVEEGQTVGLRLVACYAFDRKKYAEKRIAFGEGLLGQTYLEAQTVRMTKIPKGYMSITSGLGDAPPSALVIVPLQYNSQVKAVLELASFEPFSDNQVSFLEKAGEYLAATLTSAQTSEKTRLLLEQAQQQSEQMQAQEEVMRRNMEELTATQEEMRRQQQGHIPEIEQLKVQHEQHLLQTEQHQLSLKGVISAVDSTLATIEFDLAGTVLRANENFLEVMGYSLDEITGKPHRMFVDPIDAQSAHYLKFWADLQLGKPQVGEVKRLAKDGHEVWLSASYTPVLNEQQKPIKIIKFAHNITLQKQAALDHQGQLEAIAKSNAVVEFDLEGRILEANENFLALTGYGLLEIKGRHHRLFVSEQEQASVGYQAFWEKLKAGEFVSGEFRRVAKGEKEIYIKGSYNPIKDFTGRPYKIVKYAQDITAQKQLEIQTQQQTEELRASEEEMRQNLEELSAIQEEMQRKEQEYLSKIARLERKQ